MRSGINAVPAGQAEAARAIGLTSARSLRTIVLPQAFRTVVPPLGNVLIALAKNTSIAAGFAVTELTAALQSAVQRRPPTSCRSSSARSSRPTCSSRCRRPGLIRRDRAAGGDRPMTTSTVLFDVPGPARAAAAADRHRRRRAGRRWRWSASALRRLAANEPARPGALGDPVRHAQRRSAGARHALRRHAAGGGRRHGRRPPCWARCWPSGGCRTTRVGAACRSPPSSSSSARCRC